jgi:hypothetical protein
VFFEAVELVGSNVTEAEASEIGFPLPSRTVRLISDVNSWPNTGMASIATNTNKLRKDFIIFL